MLLVHQVSVFRGIYSSLNQQSYQFGQALVLKLEHNSSIISGASGAIFSHIGTEDRGPGLFKTSF